MKQPFKIFLDANYPQNAVSLIVKNEQSITIFNKFTWFLKYRIKIKLKYTRNKTVYIIKTMYIINTYFIYKY